MAITAPPSSRARRSRRLEGFSRNAMAPRLSAVVVERVPRGPDGPDQFGLAVEGARPAEQALAREDASGMLEEMAQQPELGRAERDRPAGAFHLVADNVHFEVGEAK